MSDQVTVKISGLAELQKAFEQMPKDVADKVIRGTLKDAGEMMKTETVSRAPVIEQPTPYAPAHFVAEHFKVTTHVHRKDIAASVMVGPTNEDFPDAGGGFRKKIGKSGKEQLVGRISVASVVRFLEYGFHDRAGQMAKKNPFFSRTWEATKERALSMIVDGLRDALKKFGLR